MKYTVKFTNEFKKNRKLMKKRGLNVELLDNVIEMLANGWMLEAKYMDHALKGDKNGFRECHIKPDWLLIYQIDCGVLVLTCIQTGTHSDLLGF